MAMQGTESEYQRLLDAARQLNFKIKDIDEKLIKVGLKKTSENVAETIQVRLQREGGEYPAEEVKKYIGEANKLCRDLEEFKGKFEQSKLLEVMQQKSVREAERSDHWKLWVHKLIRWTAGVVGAVVLYSAIVELSCLFDIVHIPVRDLVIDKTCRSE